MDGAPKKLQVYLLTPMNRAMLLNAKSTISHCPQNLITRQRVSVDSTLLHRPRNVGYLARSVNLPTGLYILPSISFFKIKQSLLRIYWTDFHDFFSPNGRYLRECCQSVSAFQIPQGTLTWQPILDKIGEMTFIQHPGILKRSWILQYG